MDFIKLYHSYRNVFLPDIKLFEKKKLRTLEKKKIFFNYIQSPFISKDIKEKLEKKIDKTSIYDYLYKLELPQGIVNFHFVSDRNLKTINRLKKFYFYLIYLQLNSKKKYKYLDDVFINIITVDIPKKLSVPINIDDINSASTVINHPRFGGPIYIWRTDEMEKVLIHETLHSLLYDWDIIDQKLNEDLRKLEKSIDKDGKGLNINEAYTELCATFIMCLFQLSKRIGKREAKVKLKKILKKVLDHSFRTCAKLFRKYQIKDCSACTDVSNMAACTYYQEASAFSYIVLKTALLWSIMKNCKIKDQKVTDKVKCLEEFLSIGFNGRIGELYQDYLVKILNDKDFNSEINKYIEKRGKGRPGKFYFTIFHQ